MSKKPNWDSRGRELHELEWQLGTAFLTAVGEGLDRLRQQGEVPDVKDLVALLEAGGALARQACGMTADQPPPADDGESSLVGRLERALARAYPTTEAPNA